MNCKGFALIELVVVLALIAVLFVFSIASWSTFTERNDKEVLINELSSVIQYAKIQAAKRGHSVSLEPINSELNWAQGALLTELNKHGIILFQWQWHHRNWQVTWVGVNRKDKLIISNIPGTALSNGKFILINTRTKERTVLVLNRLGRIRVENNLFPRG